jgi:hypothetical protein
MQAPLRGLSCPDGSRGVIGRQDAPTPRHRSFRSFGLHGRGAHDPRSTMAADP